MKHGATTVHRLYGIGIGYCGRVRDRRSIKFVNRQVKLRNARLAIHDEVSMLGRAMHGKMDFMIQDAIGSVARQRFGDPVPSMGGLDVLEVGDLKQAPPIGDKGIFATGPYKGAGKNLPPGGGDRPDDDLDTAGLVLRGQAYVDEIDDVVFLRRVFRLDEDGLEGMTAEEREEYAREARTFRDVTKRMADGSLTESDYKWLSQFNRSRLKTTERGRRQLEDCEGAVVLMDAKRDKQNSENGANRVNFNRLVEHALERAETIAKLRANHGYTDDADGANGEEMDEEEFRGMPLFTYFADGARVLLTVNLWVEAGLMNGAAGVVKGFMWPEGGDPASTNEALRLPKVIFVEFDDVNMTDRTGREVSFFPNDPVRRRWVPIFPQVCGSSTEKGVYRKQFPLTLAWALTVWKAQGMNLRRARVRLSSTTGVARYRFRGVHARATPAAFGF